MTTSDDLGYQPQDTVFAPPTYPAPAPDANITWRDVLVDGASVGLLSTDYLTSVQFTSIDQPDPARMLIQYLQNMREGDIPASAVYDAAELAVPGVQFGDEQHGTLDDFNAAWEKLST
jgi:hypothetical protein